MSVHLQKALKQLEQMLLGISSLAQQNIQKAVQAFEQRDTELARQVMDADDEIDAMEVDIEEECLKMLALYQPVAVDLRFIVAALKINNDLERVGDLAKNIAKRVDILAQNPQVQIPFDFKPIGKHTLDLLDKTLDAFVQLDLHKAYEIGDMDKLIDEEHSNAENAVIRAIQRTPENDRCLLQTLWVSRSLERVGDHATNIAEDIIYILEGEIIRHSDKEQKS
ncbi:MAG: phosphate signaling complex protein PhoU [Verrucomicrobiota bacterium]